MCITRGGRRVNPSKNILYLRNFVVADLCSCVIIVIVREREHLLRKRKKKSSRSAGVIIDIIVIIIDSTLRLL